MFPELYLIIFPDSYLWHKFLIDFLKIHSDKFTPKFPSKDQICEIITVSKNVQKFLKAIFRYLSKDILFIFISIKINEGKTQFTLR